VHTSWPSPRPVPAADSARPRCLDSPSRAATAAFLLSDDGAFVNGQIWSVNGGRTLRAMLTRRMDFVRATDASVTVARVVAVGFAVYGLATGMYQLAVLAPFLWMMGTNERHLARAMAHRYAYDGDGYRQRSERRWIHIM